MTDLEQANERESFDLYYDLDIESLWEDNGASESELKAIRKEISRYYPNVIDGDPNVIDEKTSVCKLRNDLAKILKKSQKFDGNKTYVKNQQCWYDLVRVESNEKNHNSGKCKYFLSPQWF